MPRRSLVILVACSIAAVAMLVPLRGLASQPPLVDGDDARRFVDAWQARAGHPDAAALRRHYFEPGSEALHDFDVAAIGGVDAMAAAIATRRDDYQRAIERCLPEQAAMEAIAGELVDDYRRLVPDFPRPTVYLLFGAGNSAGMKLPGHNVAMALERFCGDDWEMQFRQLLAHELAHTAQPDLPENDPARRDLLMWALREGAANYFAALVLGQDPSGIDNAWAMARERSLLASFVEDRAIVKRHWQGPEPDPEAVAAGTRWMWNAGTAERPADLAYWIGQRLWHHCRSRARDPSSVLHDMLVLDDPEGALACAGPPTQTGATLKVEGGENVVRDSSDESNGR
ncbi:hypothetical protein OK348_00015 [Flavobacterium sp. MXW15]|uniref:DUF2268 domain-containing protein n=1 Tax=Xanthomonas chitinilytica TaxID=2989819 RepID=A0ABT3JQY4_9XANT|nr:hypothetical protein [Xanthomonas sp. H13-6]MCW4453189.1 hypothetical protein [Flavobacterium sp. MXW15]MCW4470903.1 hypothetical protein [Xanthomonas sp. H13-6]